MKEIVLKCILFLVVSVSAQALEKPMVVVIPSYNNEQWYESNLSTVIDQDYENFRIIYINDCSRDRTAECIAEFLKKIGTDNFRILSFEDRDGESIPETVARFKEEVNKERVFFTLVNNVTRCGAMENLYRAIHSCDQQEIIVTVDGDDWLPHEGVLKQLNDVYLSGEVWMTHGRLVEYPHGGATWCEPVPSSFIASNTVRQYKCPSHLRTFYTWIFKKIALEDFLYEGRFFAMAWDMAIMYPILEMAAERHRFIYDVNYVYNIANAINDNKVNAQLQNDLDRYIRQMPPYQRLESAE